MSTYKVPLFDLNFDDEEKNALLEVLDSKWISTGPVCVQFEKEFSDLLEVGHGLAVSSCTSALHLALRSLGIGPGDEVLVPSLTFVATVNAILYVGAKPVFVDVQGDHDLNISVKDIRDKISARTKALIIVHFAGFPCDMNNILSLCKENDLRLIEDACHGPLSEYQGQKLGTFGDVGVFSFFSNKNISTGEGGMFVTDDESVYSKAKLMRSHGMTSLSYERASGHAISYDVVELGYNYRMDDMRAAIGRAQLKKLKGDIEKRREIRKAYIEALERLAQFITIPFKYSEETVSNYIFPIVLNERVGEMRDVIRNILGDLGVQTSIHYPPVHLFNIYKSQTKVYLPKTESYYNRCLTLPMHSRLDKVTIEYIVNGIESVFENQDLL